MPNLAPLASRRPSYNVAIHADVVTVFVFVVALTAAIASLIARDPRRTSESAQRRGIRIAPSEPALADYLRRAPSSGAEARYLLSPDAAPAGRVQVCKKTRDSFSSLTLGRFPVVQASAGAR